MRYLRTTFLGLASALLLTQCEKTRGGADMSFAKSTFESLARGDTAVRDNIDWPTLQSTEVAADSGGGTVTITVTERDGKERVSGLGFIR